MQARLNWLQPDPLEADWGDTDLKTMAALGVKPPARN